MCKAHYRDALDEFRTRPIKNYDFTPTTNEIIQLIQAFEQEKNNKSGQSHPIIKRDKVIESLTLNEFQAMGNQTKKLRDFFSNKVEQIT